MNTAYFKDRFLWGIIIGISILVVTALVLFFLRQEQAGTTDESTPAGVVESYILALQQGDDEKAYAHLVHRENRPTLAMFREALFPYQRDQINRTAVEVGDTIFGSSGRAATVQVIFIRGSQGLLGDRYQEAGSFMLVEQNGAWKIEHAPYPFWSYNWYLSPPPGILPQPET